MDQNTMANIFRIIHVRPFQTITPNSTPSTTKKETPSTIKDLPSTPNNPPIRPHIEIRIPKRTRQKLEKGLVKCLFPSNAGIFTVLLPFMINNDESDPYTLDWYNVNFIKSCCTELNDLLEKQVFKMVPKVIVYRKRIYGFYFVNKIKY